MAKTAIIMPATRVTRMTGVTVAATVSSPVISDVLGGTVGVGAS